MPISISNIPESKKQEVPAIRDYSELWGYYTFSQTVQYDYTETGDSGLSYASITINGFFTINSELEIGVSDESGVNISDSEKSDILFKRYLKLRNALISRVGKRPPKTLEDIGTERDDRCVKLPGKLLNNIGENVYAIPTSFSTTEITPEILRYTVVLTEPKKVPCKIVIGEDIINEASLTIVCRRPRIAYNTFAFASGSEAHVTGIDNRKYTLSGTINGVENIKYDDFVFVPEEMSDSNSSNIINSNSKSYVNYMSKDAVDVISNIINKQNGKVDIGIQKSSDSAVEKIFEMMISSHNVGYMLANNVASIEISGEECGGETDNYDYSNNL